MLSFDELSFVDKAKVLFKVTLRLFTNFHHGNVPN